jgi:hypothetical protein
MKRREENEKRREERTGEENRGEERIMIKVCFWNLHGFSI